MVSSFCPPFIVTVEVLHCTRTREKPLLEAPHYDHVFAIIVSMHVRSSVLTDLNVGILYLLLCGSPDRDPRTKSSFSPVRNPW